jgi:hypothetical protein
MKIIIFKSLKSQLFIDKLFIAIGGEMAEHRLSVIIDPTAYTLCVIDPPCNSTAPRIPYRREQAEVIMEVIYQYGLRDNIGYFVTDNATNNNATIDILIDLLLLYLSRKQRHDRRLRCLGHVINLAAKSFLFRKLFKEFQ